MGQGHQVREYPIEASTSDLLFASRSIEGALTGNPATGDATLKFSVLTGVAAVIETMPLEKAAEACAKMMAGKARLRMNRLDPMPPSAGRVGTPISRSELAVRSVGTWSAIVRCAAICLAFLAFTVQGAIAQGVPTLSGRQAPIEHRQPTPSDLPPMFEKRKTRTRHNPNRSRRLNHPRIRRLNHRRSRDLNRDSNPRGFAAAAARLSCRSDRAAKELCGRLGDEVVTWTERATLFSTLAVL
jgi:hypothetical protein